MKVLVAHRHKDSTDHYAGTRLRKNVKGALELTSTAWVESMYAMPDIVHLLSPEDEYLLDEAKEIGAKTVVSTLYSESDPTTRLLTLEPGGYYSLGKKSARFLEKADLVLVPSEAHKAALVSSGVEPGKIEIVTPGVNLARFDPRSDVERIIFRRYFRLERETPYVLSVGSLEDEERLEALTEVAASLPQVKFYYLGIHKKSPAKPAYLKRKSKKLPLNLILTNVVEDDVYRSGISGAIAYVGFSSIDSDETTALEAMAAKTPVLMLGRPFYEESLASSKAYLQCPSTEKVAKAIEAILLGKGGKTIIEGYKKAREHSLPELGKRLLELYGRLLPAE